MTRTGERTPGGWSAPTRVVAHPEVQRRPERPSQGQAERRSVPGRSVPPSNRPYPRVQDGQYGRDYDVVSARRAAAAFGPPARPGAVDILRAFVRRYGWRAYALPVLSILTVVALTTTGTGAPKPVAAAPTTHRVQVPAAPTISSAPVAHNSIALKSDSAPAGNSHVLNPGALPPGPAYTKAGDGSFTVVPGTSPKVGHGPLYRYTIEVENGITGINVAEFADLVQKTLSDPRSWSGHGVALQRVDSGPADFRVSLTSSMTVRKYCGFDIPVETSCYAPTLDGRTADRVVLNDARWVRGAPAYIGDLAQYRIYMINHEDGHALGHQHAHSCLPGGWAPVMMQQTYGLIDAVNHQACKANPWPYPPGVSGAPGAEQPDTPQNDELALAAKYGR